MKLGRIGFGLSASLLFVMSAAGAAPGSPAARPEVVPVKVRQDFVLVPVRVPNATRTLTFLLDTGAEITTIDQTLARELDLRGTEDIEIQTVGAESQATSVVVPELRLGRNRIRSVKVAIYDLSDVRRSLGAVDGVLGIDFLARFAFTIDYSRQLLLLEDPSSVHPPADAMSILTGKGGCLLPVSLNGQSPTELLLDTGTNMTQLPASIWRKAEGDGVATRRVMGVASSGVPSGASSIGRLGSLRIGKYTVASPVVRINQPGKQGTFSEEDAPGLLASDVLRRFLVTVDLPQEKLWLRPDPGFKADPYEFSSIGIQFLQEDGEFYVASVWAGSPAERAGVARGDRIVNVEGAKAHRLSKKQLSKLLHGPEGSVLHLTIDHAGHLAALSLQRQKLL